MRYKNDGLPMKKIFKKQKESNEKTLITEDEADCSYISEVKPRSKNDSYTATIKHYDNMYKKKGTHPGKNWIFLCTASVTDNYYKKANYKIVNKAYNKSGNLLKDFVAVFQYIGNTVIIKPN